MNHTKNYDLPQWELNDLIRMEDFNQMAANIESGIDGAKAEAKAADAELDRKINSANAKAENAQSVANAAQNAANRKPYVTGSYFGQGSTYTVNLGFRPSFVIISGMTPCNHSASTGGYERYIAFTGGYIIRDRVSFTDTGFTVHAPGTNFHPHLCESGRMYEYIAFK